MGREDKTNLALKILGIFILTMGILIILHALIFGHPDWIFWFCYMGMILIGIGALTKQPLLVKVQLNILTIPLALWVIDFFSILIMDYSLFGISGYFFSELNLVARILSLEHFYLLPVGYMILFLLGESPKAWKLSAVQAAVIIFLTRILTSSSNNVNAVFSSRFNFIPNGDSYLVSFLIVCFLMVIVTDFFIDKLFCYYRKVTKRKIYKL